MTTKTIKPSGGDYTTLTAWVGSLAATLTSPQQADIYNFGAGGLVESGGVAINGFTTTSTNRLIFNVPVGERHNGIAHSGAYLTNITGGFGTTTWRLGTNVDHVTVSYLEIESLDTASGAATHWNTACNTGSDFVMNNCIIHGVSNVQGVTFAANGNFTYRNNLIYSNAAIRLVDARGVTTFELSYCTLWTNGGDFPWLCDNNASNVIKDCYVGGASNACYFSVFCGTGNNNASADVTATVCYSSSVNSIAGASAFTSVIAGSEDFTTKTGFTGLNDLGVVLGAVTIDIINTSRPQGSAPDIGIFENIVSSGSSTHRLLLLGIG